MKAELKHSLLSLLIGAAVVVTVTGIALIGSTYVHLHPEATQED